MARWDETRKRWRITASAYRPGEPRRRIVQSLGPDIPNTAAGRRQAEQEELKLRADVLRAFEDTLPGGLVRDSFAQAADAWVARHARWSPKTVKETRYALRRYILPTLGSTLLAEVTPVQIEGLYGKWVAAGYADSTQRRWHGMIRSIFSDAVRLGLLDRNPMVRVNPAGGTAPERMHIPTPADVRAAINAAASPAAATFFELAAATGTRRGTLTALRWHHVDLEAGTVTFAYAVAIGENGPVLKGTKANRPYAVHLPKNALDALRAHHRRAAETALAVGQGGDLGARFVFSNDADGRNHWSVEYPSHAWRIACRRAGITPCRLHDLRHFAATQLLANRVPYRVVAERLGCTEANVIKTYSHWVPSAEDARAAEVMAEVMSI